MIVGLKTTANPTVARISPEGMRTADWMAKKITNLLGLQYMFFPSSAALLFHPWFKSADIIQLYNTHGNYFSHSVLPFMSRRKRIVWRLSDMWPATGHCAYSGDCDRWIVGCYKCPYLDSYPPLAWDSSSWLWRWKKYLYRNTRLHIVAPSFWIKDIAEKSPLLNRFPKTIIVNGVDIEMFRPLSKDEARKALNIPPGKKVILFLAHVVQNNPRKGGDYVIRALNRLMAEGHRDFIAFLVGRGAENWGQELRCPTRRHNLINNDEQLSQVYNCADLLIHPSVVENLPNCIIEAMACGTPAIAFDVGGVKEVILHKENGYLAKYKDDEDLFQGLKWLLNHPSLHAALGEKCRAWVENTFSLKLQTQRFLDLFQELMSHH
jgi:glycosyltransferase involved in cell wall biosynthesis